MGRPDLGIGLPSHAGSVLGLTAQGNALARAVGTGAHIRDWRLELSLCIAQDGDRMPMKKHCPQPGGMFGAQGVPMQC